MPAGTHLDVGIVPVDWGHTLEHHSQSSCAPACPLSSVMLTMVALTAELHRPQTSLLLNLPFGIFVYPAHCVLSGRAHFERRAKGSKPIKPTIMKAPPFDLQI
ncbi:hypothetical protein, unlikely [Trypanosoma brucei gambiense DAL972]|uniref:Uncharacterized protein n=1 Tax=Trypanosoma brucei gambiense (strain MHOM/CI/86/DAL972) TaxID=679716 RepID=C9ZUW5_TRYB9|nr:hypothetical protein, unlikely [Trypanosoma brucei gambiense DAL972]CBH13203.1 hypothetical protein, unlikely [Trypanosoma brucei gambiense DAL972]|eukprot:XP_011775480.1 hypothetical protein, unlikely [Trypanosoma brucei gambiense DAL972]